MKARWILVDIAVTLTVGVAVYTAVYHATGQIRAAEFAKRPELENWTLPYLGAEQTAIPAAVAASILCIAIVLVVWGVRQLRSTRAIRAVAVRNGPPGS